MSVISYVISTDSLLVYSSRFLYVFMVEKKLWLVASVQMTTFSFLPNYQQCFFIYLFISKIIYSKQVDSVLLLLLEYFFCAQVSVLLLGNRM